MLAFRNPEDKTSCMVLNLLDTENQRSAQPDWRELQYSQDGKAWKQIPEHCIIASVLIKRRRMELMRRRSKLAVYLRTRLRTWVFKAR